MLVGSVTGVDHRAIHPGGNPVGGPGRFVPDDQKVGSHCSHGQRRVLEALTLRHRRGSGGKGHHVGGKRLRGPFEGQPGPGGCLEEERRHRSPAQGRDLGYVTTEDLPKLVGQIQKILDLGAVEIRHREEVLHSPVLSIQTPCSRSIASTRTVTRSSSEVGTFLPT